MIKTHAAALCAAALGAGVPAAHAAAADFGYTYVDFGAVGTRGGLRGTRSSTPTQTVSIDTDNGEGLTVAGSLEVGERFYLRGSYDSAVIDVSAVVRSPLAIVSTGGNFDRTASRAAFGYHRAVGDKLNVFAEVTWDSVNYDFGSFAGENFDTKDSGAGVGVGLRFRATESLELYAGIHGSPVGEVDLSRSTLSSGSEISAGLRYYFFEDLGFGFDLRSGDVDSLTLAMRFGFGELRAGRR
jgi:hypothetical protein